MRIGIRTVLAVVASVAFAAAVAYAAVSQTIALGTMAHSDLFGGPATVFMRTLTVAPGEVLGWHYHPGVGAYTIVTQGPLVVEDGCGGETVYATGEAFLEPPYRVHRGKNLTDGTVITAQTFIVPAELPTSVSTTQMCGPPLKVDDCRNAGWMQFDHPRAFSNQGECQQFVITGK